MVDDAVGGVACPRMNFCHSCKHVPAEPARLLAFSSSISFPRFPSLLLPANSSTWVLARGRGCNKLDRIANWTITRSSTGGRRDFSTAQPIFGAVLVCARACISKDQRNSQAEMTNNFQSMFADLGFDIELFHCCIIRFTSRMAASWCRFGGREVPATKRHANR
jgi:hypothetical protein